MPPKAGLATEGDVRSSGQRGLVSLLLLVHLFFVATALLAGYARSELTGRLLTRFAAYTRLFNIELNLDFAPYYLTHATEADVDHRIEVLPRPTEDALWTVMPDGGFRGSERYKRQQRLARFMAFLADTEDERVAWLGRSVGEHFLHARNIVPDQVRCRRHLLQHWEAVDGGSPAERDPHGDLYFRVPYAARCVVREDGNVVVVRVGEAGHVALPGSSRDASDQ